jgi:Sec-independent protein translocase protein TatA
VEKISSQDVATDIKVLRPDVPASYVDEVTSIEALSKDIKEMIKNFRKEHAERKTEFNTMMECFLKSLRKEIQQFMEGVDSENSQHKAESVYLLGGIKENMRKGRTRLVN